MYRFSHVTFALTLSLLACQSSVPTERSSIRDQVLSTDRKPVHLPLVPIDASALDEDAFARVVAMSPAEWMQRASAFRVRCKIGLEWPHADAVADEHTWRQAANGDYAVRHFSKGGGSVEWLKVGDKLLVKNQKGEWREKGVRAEQQDEEPQSVLDSVSDLFALVGGVTLAHPEAKSVQGRPAYAYKLSRAAAPAPKTSNGKPTRLLGDDVEPGELSGTLSIDKATGILLAADVHATVYALPMPTQPRPVTLPSSPPLPPSTKTAVTVTLAFTVDQVGDSAFAPDLPKYIAEIQRQRPPSMPLSFWEAPKSGSAKEQEGSVPGKTGATKEPEEEE